MSSKDNVVFVDFAARKAKKSAEVEIPKSDVTHDKMKKFGEMLEQGTVMLVLDARAPGVQVPPDLADQADLRLNFSYRFGWKDFAFNEEGVSATMRFSQGFFFCMVPWAVVYGMIAQGSGQSHVWPDAIPEELRT